MTYILHTYLPPKMKVEKALQLYMGIGKFRSIQICSRLGLKPKILVSQLKSKQIESITQILKYTYYTKSFLKRIINDDIQRLIKIGSYRGFRHVQGLPVRGQRTRTNSRTIRRLKKSFLKTNTSNKNTGKLKQNTMKKNTKKK